MKLQDVNFFIRYLLQFLSQSHIIVGTYKRQTVNPTPPRRIPCTLLNRVLSVTLRLALQKECRIYVLPKRHPLSVKPDGQTPHLARRGAAIMRHPAEVQIFPVSRHPGLHGARWHLTVGRELPREHCWD